MIKIPIKYVRTDVRVEYRREYHGFVLWGRSDNGNMNSVCLANADFMTLTDLENKVKWYIEDVL